MRSPGSFYPPSRNHSARGASLPSHVPGATLQQGASGVYMGCAGIPSMSPMGTAPKSTGSFGQPTMNVSQMHAGMNFPQGIFTPQRFPGSAPVQNMSGIRKWTAWKWDACRADECECDAFNDSMMPGMNFAGNVVAQFQQWWIGWMLSITAATALNSLDASAMPPPTPNVWSAFEMLGKAPVTSPIHEKADEYKWQQSAFRLGMEALKHFVDGYGSFPYGNWTTTFRSHVGA